MIPEMSDPPIAKWTPNPFPFVEADGKIVHIASFSSKRNQLLSNLPIFKCWRSLAEKGFYQKFMTD